MQTFFSGSLALTVDYPTLLSVALCYFRIVFLQLLRPEEVEMLVCGSPELDMSTLQKTAQYEGYSKTDATIR